MSSSMKILSGEISFPKETGLLQDKASKHLSWIDLPDGIPQKIRAFVGVSNDYPAFALTCQAWSRVVWKNGILDVSDSPQLNDAQFIALIDGLKIEPDSGVHTVFLSRCISLTEKAVFALRGFSVTSISIQGCLIPEECLSCFYQAKHLRLNSFKRSFSAHSLNDFIDIAPSPIYKMPSLETLYIGKRKVSLLFNPHVREGF